MSSGHFGPLVYFVTFSKTLQAQGTLRTYLGMLYGAIISTVPHATPNDRSQARQNRNQTFPVSAANSQNLEGLAGRPEDCRSIPSLVDLDLKYWIPSVKLASCPRLIKLSAFVSLDCSTEYSMVF